MSVSLVGGLTRFSWLVVLSMPKRVPYLSSQAFVAYKESEVVGCRQ